MISKWIIFILKYLDASVCAFFLIAETEKTRGNDLMDKLNKVAHLCASLLVGILVLHPVHLETVRLEGAALREGFLAEIALVGPDAGVGARVALEVEGVIEAFAAEGAEVPLDVRVALHVAIEKPLQCKCL